MPPQKRPKPLYQRGDFALRKRAGRTNLEILWYDSGRGRSRSISAGTGDVGEAKEFLDRLYLAGTGHRVCPTCRRPWDSEKAQAKLLTVAIADYLIVNSAKAGAESARNRLGHVTSYVAQTDLAITCPEIDEAWVEGFRNWLLAKPVTGPSGRILRERSLSHVEGCVMQLAAVINGQPGLTARFRAQQMIAVATSPVYRADVKMLAAMFRYAMAEEYRINLLRYLQLAVATWARPDAILEAKSDQWYPSARVLDLNPKGRRQTKKHRPVVPVPHQMGPLLDAFTGNWIPVTTIRGSWDKMRVALELPTGGESGPKVIRRSMATIARRQIGEANWRQGEMMLGHVKSSISDIYALPDPANLGLALSVTESIIDEIAKLAPGAFHRKSTAEFRGITLIKGHLNA